MRPITTLAAEFGISTKKAEELAKNTGVMMIRLKSGGFVAPEDKFRRQHGRYCGVLNVNTDLRTGITRC